VLGAAAAVIVIWLSLWGGTMIGTTAPPTRLGHPLLVATVDDALKQADPATAASPQGGARDPVVDARCVE